MPMLEAHWTTEGGDDVSSYAVGLTVTKRFLPSRLIRSNKGLLAPRTADLSSATL
jgi:hypothetical protein